MPGVKYCDDDNFRHPKILLRFSLLLKAAALHHYLCSVTPFPYYSSEVPQLCDVCDGVYSVIHPIKA
jgi:hypothetical protein